MSVQTGPIDLMSIRGILFTLLACAWPIEAAVAQDQPRGESQSIEDHWSIALGVPGGGTATAGLWRMVSSRTNLGIELELTNRSQRQEFRSGDQSTARAEKEWSFLLSPTLKWYLSHPERVAPFVGAAVGAGYGHSEITGPLPSSDLDGNILRFGAMSGLGADWFPLEGISVGGLVGFRAEWRRDTRSFESREIPDEREVTRFDLEAFASELRLHIYF